MGRYLISRLLGLLRRKAPPVVFLGGEWIVVQPLGLERALELLFVLAPYVVLLERHLPTFQAALEATNGARPRLLSAMVRTVAQEMADAPGDLTRVVALLVDRDPEWVARHALPEQVVQALPVLDQANDFGALLVELYRLGLRVSYEVENNGGIRPTN